jgi:hypothetical protein
MVAGRICGGREILVSLANAQRPVSGFGGRMSSGGSDGLSFRPTPDGAPRIRPEQIIRGDVCRYLEVCDDGTVHTSKDLIAHRKDAGDWWDRHLNPITDQISGRVATYLVRPRRQDSPTAPMVFGLTVSGTRYTGDGKGWLLAECEPGRYRAVGRLRCRAGPSIRRRRSWPGTRPEPSPSATRSNRNRTAPVERDDLGAAVPGFFRQGLGLGFRSWRTGTWQLKPAIRHRGGHAVEWGAEMTALPGLPKPVTAIWAPPATSIWSPLTGRVRAEPAVACSVRTLPSSPAGSPTPKRDENDIRDEDQFSFRVSVACRGCVESAGGSAQAQPRR